MDIWKPQNIELSKIYLARFGPLNLWLRQSQGEIHVAQTYDVETSTMLMHGLQVYDQVLPASIPWSRWIVEKDTRQVRLTPCLPNRPVVVRTESPVKISVGKGALFYVSFPIWIKVEAGEGNLFELCDVPSAVRSNTWFGDSMAGELCYSLITRARRQIEDADHPVYKALCPVRIQNESEDRLDVERFCLHVEHLNLYQGTYLLWTNEVTIAFQGEGQISKVDYAKHKPKLGSALKLITAPRTPFKETLLKRSLGSFVRLSDS